MFSKSDVRALSPKSPYFQDSLSELVLYHEVNSHRFSELWDCIHPVIKMREVKLVYKISLGVAAPKFRDLRPSYIIKA